MNVKHVKERGHGLINVLSRYLTEKPKKTMKNFSQECPSQDSNWKPPKCESKVQLLELICSVFRAAEHNSYARRDTTSLWTTSTAMAR
jgi:DNA-directed RNA polymerase subunit L